MSATDSQQLIVRQIFEKRDGARFDLIALRTETGAFSKNQAEHTDSVRIEATGNPTDTLEVS